MGCSGLARLNRSCWPCRMESTTSIEAVLSCGEQLLEVQHLAIGPDMIVIQLGRHGESAPCPSCGSASRRVQSRYMRTIADLPWRGTPVMPRWEVRRFFCDDDVCAQVIFRWRQGGPPGAWSRRWPRSEWSAAEIRAVACLPNLGIHTCGDTILRRVRALPVELKLTPRVIGFDDLRCVRASVRDSPRQSRIPPGRRSAARSFP